MFWFLLFSAGKYQISIPKKLAGRVLLEFFGTAFVLLTIMSIWYVATGKITITPEQLLETYGLTERVQQLENK